MRGRIDGRPGSMPGRGMTSAPLDDWVLRPATDGDAGRLHALLGIPEVYRYLADGVPPPREVVDAWIVRSHADFAAVGVGLWLLEDGTGGLAGCVRLEVTGPTTAELVYALHPRRWGSGLATRMSWTVMSLALGGGRLAEIVAGADEPNLASIAVMHRLGMTYERAVHYPLGAGVEYCFRRGDAGPTPPPAPIAIARSS
jgi:RimJ/RimL family protein N-acetyltransferase